MNIAVIFASVLLVSLAKVDATKYSKCGLAKALLKNGIPRDKLDNWVCLVMSESSGNTAAKGGPNSDGSYDYGLYQINNRYWCTEGHPGHGCNVDCYKLLNNNISDDTKCALLIYNQSGFQAWNGWKAKCQNGLPDLSDCGV